MKIVSLPRRAGRTTKAVEWVKQDPRRILVVLTKDEQKHVRDNFDIAEEQVMTVADLRRPDRIFAGRHHEPEIVLDNIERILPALFSYPLNISGFTCEPAERDFFGEYHRKAAKKNADGWIKHKFIANL